MASAAWERRPRAASGTERSALVAYAKNLGLAFQIVDDLIDATCAARRGGEGRGPGRQEDDFRLVRGVAGAWLLAGELIDTSEAALRGFGPRAQPLRDLARYVVSRRR